MTKAELIKAVSELSGVNRSAVENVLDTLSGVVAEQLTTGSPVPIPGIGKLSPKRRAGRTGRNPATGETIDIPARTVPHITFAASLRQVLEELDG